MRDHMQLKALNQAQRCVYLVALLCGWLSLVPKLASAESEPIDIEVTGTIDAPYAEVVAVLLDLERFGDWFPSLSRWEVLSRTDVAVVYGRQDLPWPLADRDYVVEYRWSTDASGEFRLEANGTNGAGPAPFDEVIRLERLRSQWTVRDAGDGSAVRYHYSGDPGGSIPDWIGRIGWRSQAKVLIEQLEGEVTRRRNAPVTPAVSR